MLYDNAQLAEVYVDAYQRTQKDQYREVAEGIFHYIEEMMTDPRGGFYSALDAETDGVEGEYYVWSKDEIQEILAPAGFKYFATAYGVNQETTFEHGYVLHLPQSIAESAQTLGIPVSELKTRLGKMRNELLAKRRTRKPLRRDDKVLTSWNGLMIRAYARAGQQLQRQDYIDTASKAALYLLTTLRDKEGRLLRSARNHQASLPAYLDDYAFLVSGLLALHEATQEEKWLNAARLLTDQQISLFHDAERGGFYFTSHDHESLIARTKSAYDSVLPSGNSVSIQNLTRLGKLSDDRGYSGIARKTINAFSQQLRQSPGGLAYFSLASQEYLEAFGASEKGEVANNLFNGGVSSSESTNGTTMPKKDPSLSKDLIVHLSTKKNLKNDAKIDVQGFFAQSGVKAGGKLGVAIRININEGWHINANPAQPDFVIPTQLDVPKGSLFKLQNVKYPPGHEFRLQGIEEALSVYEESVLIRGELLIPSDATGEMPVSLKLKSQACNNQTCFPPLILALEGTVHILKENEKATPLNLQFFGQK